MVRSRKPGDVSNEQLDRKIALGTLEIYEHFYQLADIEDRRLLNLMISDELKFFTHFIPTVPYFKAIKEEVEIKILDIRKRNKHRNVNKTVNKKTLEQSIS